MVIPAEIFQVTLQLREHLCGVDPGDVALALECGEVAEIILPFAPGQAVDIASVLEGYELAFSPVG